MVVTNLMNLLHSCPVCNSENWMIIEKALRAHSWCIIEHAMIERSKSFGIPCVRWLTQVKKYLKEKNVNRRALIITIIHLFITSVYNTLVRQTDTRLGKMPVKRKWILITKNSPIGRKGWEMNYKFKRDIKSG